MRAYSSELQKGLTDMHIPLLVLYAEPEDRALFIQ